MKLVIDTNVLVSGALGKGNSAGLIDALLAGKATLCISSSLLVEFEEVIQREKFRRRLETQGKTTAGLLTLYKAAALIADGTIPQIPPDLRDPDDIHVLACALAADADAIVSGDAGLFDLIMFEGIGIMSVREALEQLGIATD